MERAYVYSLRKANKRYQPRKVINGSNKNNSKSLASSRYTTVEPKKEVFHKYGPICTKQACDNITSFT